MDQERQIPYPEVGRSSSVWTELRSPKGMEAFFKLLTMLQKLQLLSEGWNTSDPLIYLAWTSHQVNEARKEILREMNRQLYSSPTRSLHLSGLLANINAKNGT